jgi:hypothetical protein
MGVGAAGRYCWVCSCRQRAVVSIERRMQRESSVESVESVMVWLPGLIGIRDWGPTGASQDSTAIGTALSWRDLPLPLPLPLPPPPPAEYHLPSPPSSGRQVVESSRRHAVTPSRRQAAKSSPRLVLTLPTSRRDPVQDSTTCHGPTCRPNRLLHLRHVHHWYAVPVHACTRLHSRALAHHSPDDIEYPPPKPPMKDIVGGAGSYSALGARIFSPRPLSRKVAWIVDCGSDFPPDLRNFIAHWDSGALVRETPDRLTTRGWNGYGQNEHRGV